MKILWVDTETTGLNAVRNDVIQISGLIEIDGDNLEQFNFKMRPERPGNAEAKALAVQGRTLEEVMEWPDPKKIYAEFRDILCQYVDKFDPKDKLTPAGQNVHFDLDMLWEFFKRQGDNYFGSLVGNGRIDLIVVASMAVMCGLMPVPAIEGKPSYKLAAICEALKMQDFTGHDAMTDIIATRLCTRKLLRLFSEKGNSE